MSARSLKVLFKEFVPAETQEGLNQSPWVKGAVLVLFIVIGPLLVKKGLKGVREKYVVSKGREYTGTAAVGIGALFVLTGTGLAGSALVLAYIHFVGD
jgi:hypothetical protein